MGKTATKEQSEILYSKGEFTVERSSIIAMQARPKCSVILCCYNQGQYVQSAVESVLNQTYPHKELIVIDNASTDNTPAILDKFKDDIRVKIILHSENEAVTKCLNEGIRKSTGDFISILYSDDFYLPEKLESQVAAFEKLSNEYGVVYSPGYRLNTLTGVQWEDRTMRSSGFLLREMLIDFHKTGFINQISPLVRRECFENYPYYETIFIEGEGVFLRMASKYKFHFIPDVLVVMRDHPTNAGKAIKKTKEYVLAQMTLWLSEPDFPEAFRKLVRGHIAHMLRNYGWQSVRLAGDSQWARNCFSESIRWDVRQLFHPRTLVGTGMSFLPGGVVSLFNRVGNSLRSGPGIKGFIPDNR